MTGLGVSPRLCLCGGACEEPLNRPWPFRHASTNRSVFALTGASLSPVPPASVSPPPLGNLGGRAQAGLMSSDLLLSPDPSEMPSRPFSSARSFYLPLVAQHPRSSSPVQSPNQAQRASFLTPSSWDSF